MKEQLRLTLVKHGIIAILLGILALEPDNSDAQSLLEEAEHTLAQ